MCGRYTLYDFEDLAEHFGLGDLPDLRANYNVAPTQMMPIVTTDGLDMMRWGLIPVWARDEKIGYKLINARSETIFDKPVWRNAVSHHRCLVPANGFYEWKAWSGGKRPYFIHPSASHLFAFAGVWSSWTRRGVSLHSYAILTTTPSQQMKSIHDRMPVILHPDDEQQWLHDDSPESITALLAPYSDQLDVYKVSPDVNSTRSNSPQLIESI